MLDDRSLSMDDFSGKGDCAAKSGENTLLAHANTEHRDFSSKVKDCGGGDAGVGKGMTGAGRDDEFCRVEGDELVEGYLVVAVGWDVFDSEGHDIFYDIVCETILCQ